MSNNKWYWRFAIARNKAHRFIMRVGNAAIDGGWFIWYEWPSILGFVSVFVAIPAMVWLGFLLW